MLKKNKFLATLFVAFSLVACNQPIVYDSFAEINDSWKINDTLTFDFKATDSVQKHNIYLQIRANQAYKFNNIFILATIKAPNGHTTIDTLEYAMANPDGTLLGEGFSDTKQSKLWFKENFIFKNKGIYTFKLQQAVRENGHVNGTDSLKGITDIGLQIEKMQIKE